MTDSTATSHEEVVNAIRKALVDAIEDFGNTEGSNSILELARAYEHIQSADVAY